MTEPLRPCPACASPNLTRIKHPLDPLAAIQCADCHFGAPSSHDWNNADTPLMRALEAAKQRRMQNE